MRQIEHYIQDACEILAVAEMQRQAEKLGLARGNRSTELMAEFENYVKKRGISRSDFEAFPQYVDNIRKHISVFVKRLSESRQVSDLVFSCTERESRNESKKGDFAVEIDGSSRLSVSLKNYRNSIARPQVSAGTFNSFALSFLLQPAPGVGMYVNPLDGSTFRGSSKTIRDQVLTSNGNSWAISYLNKLDKLNSEIKETFVYSPQFEFLDESKFDLERKRVGSRGAEIVHSLLEEMPIEKVREEIVSRIGFSGNEEQLMFDPTRYTDSITVPKFRELISGVRNHANFDFRMKGQGIAFEFSTKQTLLLSVHVPFTINKNGAWISENYEGTRMHPKEKVRLATGQRRPKKSKELATSVNTYLDLDSTGIFISA